MKVHIIMHEFFEAPGAIENWLKERNHRVSYSKVYLGQPIPSEISNIDLLIVLGGPQSPDTRVDECPHFDAEREKEIIRNCIKENKAVVGFCLGAQLIGEALGAHYSHSPEKEIGKFPIQMTKEGQSNSKISHFGTKLEVGHWHNDMPGLTQDAKILAYSAGCPRQIVEYTNLVYGFQCHMEFTKEVIELLIENTTSEFDNPRKFVQSPEILRLNDYSEMNKHLLVFLDKLMEEYQHKKVKP